MIYVWCSFSNTLFPKLFPPVVATYPRILKSNLKSNPCPFFFHFFTIFRHWTEFLWQWPSSLMASFLELYHCRCIWISVSIFLSYYILFILLGRIRLGILFCSQFLNIFNIMTQLFLTFCLFSIISLIIHRKIINS